MKKGVKNTKEVSRVHLIEHDEKSNLISIMGGKWTIFRKMGEEGIDKALELLLKKEKITYE